MYTGHFYIHDLIFKTFRTGEVYQFVFFTVTAVYIRLFPGTSLTQDFHGTPEIFTIICQGAVRDLFIEDLQALFLSVDWSSGHFPDRLVNAMKNYETVYTAWDEDKLIGLISAMDDGNGHLYLGHQLRNGMSVVNLDDKTIRNYVNEPDDSQSIPGNNVRCIYQDHFKNIWVGTNMGLALFNPATGKFQKVTQKGRQSSENVFDIIEMPDNQLWVATDMGGIYVVSLNEVSAGKPVTYSEDVKVILTSINTRCIVRDKFGNIWVGNYSTGIDFIAAKKEDFHILANFDQKLGYQQDYEA